VARKRRRTAEHEQPDERWLLTYADMITLLMALFMVLFAISSVNTTKFESLQKSLQDAFSGKIIPGGQSVAQSGAQSNQPAVKVSAPVQSLREQMTEATSRARTGTQEAEDLRTLKAAIDSWAAAHGLARKVETRIDVRGLTVRLLTDDLLFASGSAQLEPQGLPLMRRLGGLLRTEGVHPVAVEGHTDSVPVSGRHASNWELSTDRASAVVRALARNGVSPARMTAVGHAFYDPIATNATERGRSQNRRVEILVPRTASTP